ncbi:LamG-like jellyroll fold domain-containing protein [Bremerella sp. P1]|uniref:LamG-like jellyroll fold domain-containing protein n=1 Tax=Bremerella sp. P1 TaxID=3026424 RepID=UPI002368F1FB|nr:LamG-like jellyroll fold domain-containing protein [Bremerella sp. P1]WDI40617.1 FecR domain-containing protein [Bremerella sp. P1]
MSNEPSQLTDELIERYFLDPQSLSDSEQATLVRALKEDPSVRSRFRVAAFIDAELRFESSGEESSPAPIASSSSSLGDAWPKWILAIAATLLLVGILGYFNRPAKPQQTQQEIAEQPVPSTEPEVVTAIAQLDVGHNQRFEPGFAPSGNEFHQGEYHLSEGEVTLTFQNGVAVSLESPARFSIIDSMRMQLDHGRARAIVPESGHGFVIETATMVVEDLGTEFGIVVDDNQNQELHVFAGEVRLHDKDLPPELLTENSALAWDADTQRRSITPDDMAFATSMSIGYKRWLDHSLKLRQDPSALFYFDFETDSRKSEEVINRATTGVVDNGQLTNGIWATGRWPEKGAMLFENTGDRVELNIPGKYDQITIMAWVQINRYDFALQTVFNSIDYSPGQHHWNLTRGGSLRMGLSSQYDLTSKQTLPRNLWTHVAAQIDSKAKESVYYIDGKVVGRRKWSQSIPIHYGPSTIGAWGHTNRAGEVVYSRDLRGRIDEIALFSRVLSADEIRQAYEAGSNFQ